MPHLYTLFDTPFGRSGIAWDERGITRIQLAEASAAATAARLEAHGARRARITPPPHVQDAAQRVRRHLAGKPQDFTSIPLALDGLPAPRRRIYQAARAVPAGATVSYGELAASIGSPGAARAVGAAMAENPFILAVPCHRVMGSNGQLHGFSAHGGIETKRRILALEGVRVYIPRHAPRRYPDGLEYDRAAAVDHLRRADPVLARLIRRAGPYVLAVRRMHDPFQSLVRSIVYQQLSGKAAETILGRVLDLYAPKDFPTPDDILATADATLRGAGLSAGKTRALKDLAARTREGVVPPLRALHRMGDDEVIERLTSIWGVGRWSVEMMLMFRLGRPDVLPVDDLGVRQGFDLAYGRRRPVSRDQLAEHAEAWRPYRSVASWYMYRAVDLHRKGER
ncbi:MAG TPA: methylated-DNA--[protein]-cysteine S-methyltransferase [Gemmatimonadales bacterium]|nr:methylated-DNA--[protein]-cysteine S-methyltransferase [Gemmatimonadales bacterium]